MFLLKKLKRLFCSNDGKRMQSMDSIETYAYGMSKDLVNEKEETKCNSIILIIVEIWKIKFII